MWGRGDTAPCILYLVVGEGEWTVLCPIPFTTSEQAPRTHRMGSWVDPIATVDALER